VRYSGCSAVFGVECGLRGVVRWFLERKRDPGSYEYPDDHQSDGQTLAFDSYMTPEDNLEGGQLRLLEGNFRVIVPFNTHTRMSSHAFIATLLFYPSMSALPIIAKQNSPNVGCSPANRERELGLDRRETG
jgi:hypothetical protein